MKVMFIDLLLSTIVAAFVTLLMYVLRLVDSWSEAFSTYATAVVVFMFSSYYYHWIKKQENKE